MLTIGDELRCPHCGGAFRLHQATALPEALELARRARQFGDLWPAALAYLESFQPPSGRPLSLVRAVALLGELAEMFRTRGFAYGRRRHAVDRDTLAAALKEVAALGKSGFKNHNYLKKVALEMQTRVDEQRSREREKRRGEREARLRAGLRDGEEAPPEARLHNLVGRALKGGE